MHPEFTNLLPDDRLRMLRRGYFVRLATVVGSLLIALVFTTGIFLVPAYVYLYTEIQERAARLATLESSLASSDEVALEARLSALSSNAQVLTGLGATVSASAVSLDVLAVPHPGVMLSGFSYAPAQATKPGTVVVSGKADTRDRLRAYQLAFLETSFVKGADLPISAYAKDSDIPFSITLTLAPQP